MLKQILDHLFDFNNSVNFKWFTHFGVLYGTMFGTALIAKIVRHNLDNKNHKPLKRLLRKISNLFIWVSLFGGLFLFARYAKVYFLSMNFMHVLNIAIVGLFTAMYLWDFYKKTRKS